jgi:hypothetical protein
VTKKKEEKFREKINFNLVNKLRHAHSVGCCRGLASSRSGRWMSNGTYLPSSFRTSDIFSGGNTDIGSYGVGQSDSSDFLDKYSSNFSVLNA